jgi:hypothetical protein
LDPWFNPKQTTREKYDAMMKGMDVYKCKLDRHDMMKKYEYDGIRDYNLYDFIKNVNEDFANFYILANPENFNIAALDYIKKLVMPWAQEGFKGIEGETYNKVIEYVLYSFDKNKKLHLDLQQLSAVTLGSRQSNIDVEELIREYDKIDLIKKKYQHLA